MAILFKMVAFTLLDPRLFSILWNRRNKPRRIFFRPRQEPVRRLGTSSSPVRRLGTASSPVRRTRACLYEVKGKTKTKKQNKTKQNKQTNKKKTGQRNSYKTFA